MRVVRIMANLNPGGCDVPLVHRHQSVGALNSTRTFWLGRILQMHSSAESRSRNHSVSFANFDHRSQPWALSWTLANCHVYALLYSYDVDPGPERSNTNSLPPMHRPQFEAGNHPSGPPSDILT
jgi:hypothetical protein